MTAPSSPLRTPVTFCTDDGTVLRGWHYHPQSEGDAPAPIVVLHNGFSGVKEVHLENYARVFAEAGLGALVYDHRGLGESGGRVRQEVDPAQYVADFKDAVTFAMALPRADARRVAAWGSSYGGGVVIQATATDPRVACLVVQVPFLSGGQIWRRIPPAQQAQMAGWFAQQRTLRAQGQGIGMVPVVLEDPTSGPCIMQTRRSWEWCMGSARQLPNWRNEVTVRSLELTFGFEPAAYLQGVAPRPFMMIGAEADDLFPMEATQQAFDSVSGTHKRLVTLDCDHYAPYDERFAESSTAARDWLVEHLPG